jgi:hypothetical protein
MTKYTYPDAEFWIQYLTKTEITYLLLFSYYRSKTYYNEIKESLIPFEIIDRSREIEFEEIGENSGTVEFTIGFDEQEIYLTVNGSYSGYASEGSSGSYYDPPEPGEEEMNDIDVDGMIIYVIDNDAEVDKSLIIEDRVSYIKYDDIAMIGEACICDLWNGDVSKSLDARFKKIPTELPEMLVQRIAQVREENKRQIQNNMSAKKFGI